METVLHFTACSPRVNETSSVPALLAAAGARAILMVPSLCSPTQVPEYFPAGLAKANASKESNGSRKRDGIIRRMARYASKAGQRGATATRVLIHRLHRRSF